MERRPADPEMTDNVRYRTKPKDQPDIGEVCEEQGYEAPAEDYGGPPVESYTPIEEPEDKDYVEEEYQELGESDINYVVPADSEA